GAVADESLTLACRQILSAVARVNGRFGKAKIAEMLKGSETAGIAATGLRYLPTFGLLKTWTLPAIREHIDLLSESGLLKITGLEYPLLSLSQEGLAAMKGASPIRLARAPSKQKRAKSDSAAASSPALLEALRDLRKREATERKIPAYLIFHDKTLGEIAERGPKSIEDLSEVSGLGPKKIELYGEKILALVSTHCG
ncbi:MAG: HRDC domain-containing protein, partial [Bdellovibrionota bacterium]